MMTGELWEITETSLETLRSRISQHLRKFAIRLMVVKHRAPDGKLEGLFRRFQQKAAFLPAGTSINAIATFNAV